MASSEQHQMQEDGKELIQLLQLTQDLLDCIAAGDWPLYCKLCAPELTCFEPESHGELVEGMGFHKFYFDISVNMEKTPVPPQTTVVNPKVQILAGGQVGVVTYVRLVQKQQPPFATTLRSEETRVWEKRNGQWVNVHFHRSNSA